MTRFRSALNKNKEPTPSHKKSAKESSEKPRWTQFIDAFAKLVAACAVLGATFVANEYQSSMTTVNLLAKREQAESSLRAGMFRDLIKPITGSEKAEIPVEREQLMTELLALNFHEHFELKPLMLRVDDRLANENYEGPDGELISADNRMMARKSLRSVARRVVQRQVALLTKEDSSLAVEDRSCIYDLELELDEKKSDGSSGSSSSENNHRCLQKIERKFGEFISLDSPNQVYRMNLTIEPVEKSKDSKEVKQWSETKFKVNVAVTHICFIIAQVGGIIEKINAEHEIHLISALKTANDPEFSNDADYNNAVNKALDFMWHSEDNYYGVDYLREEAITRWDRIQNYKERLKALGQDIYFKSDTEEIANPVRIAKLPPNVSCKTSDNDKNYLNSNYSLQVDNDFTLTYFDFPFTDNTLLADGTRFSIVLDKAFTEETDVATEQDEEAETEVNTETDIKAEIQPVSLTQPEMEDGAEENKPKKIKKLKKARFKIIWFPKDYIAARERPVNFADIRNKLGISFSD